jgi:hypothetical protein
MKKTGPSNRSGLRVARGESYHGERALLACHRMALVWRLVGSARDERVGERHVTTPRQKTPAAGDLALSPRSMDQDESRAFTNRAARPGRARREFVGVPVPADPGRKAGFVGAEPMRAGSGVSSVVLDEEDRQHRKCVALSGRRSVTLAEKVPRDQLPFISKPDPALRAPRITRLLAFLKSP